MASIVITLIAERRCIATRVEKEPKKGTRIEKRIIERQVTHEVIRVRVRSKDKLYGTITVPRAQEFITTRARSRGKESTFA